VDPQLDRRHASLQMSCQGKGFAEADMSSVVGIG
jgi:hypothetical protein